MYAIRSYYVGIEFVIGSVDEHDRVLEKDGRTQGRYNRREPGRMAQGFVGDPVQQDTHNPHQPYNHDRQHQNAHECAEFVLQGKRGYQGQAQIGTSYNFV